MIVMMPVCSPGSNHDGAIDTCTAHVIGAGLWAAADGGATRAASRRRDRKNDGHRVLMGGLPPCASSGVAIDNRADPIGPKDAYGYRDSPRAVKRAPSQRAFGPSVSTMLSLAAGWRPST